MKKFLTLAFALVFTTGIAFGQSNTATIAQNGDDVTNLQQQSGSYADIEQVAGNNRVVGLSGAFTQQNSDLEVFQDVAYGGAGNVVRGEQLGNNNEAYITQHNASFTQLEQRGNRNYAKVQQYNGGPDAFIEQRGNRNFVQTLQTSGVNGSFMDVLQRGNDNTLKGLTGSRAEQVNGDQTLRLDQLGNNNTLEMLQDGLTSGSNHATVSQMGNGNITTLTQMGSSNNATVTQQ
jgi:hypothetical protein